MQAALLGFSQSGKSTLLAAVSGGQVALSGSQKVEEAVVPVPDERIDWLKGLYNPKKTTYATIDCLDVPGLDFADNARRASSRKLITQVKTADLFILVVRAFENDAVPPYRASVNPVRDMLELQQELLLTDLELATTRIEKLEKQANKPSKTQQQDQAELEMQKRLRDSLESGTTIRNTALDPQELELCRQLGFLTLKPIVVAVNVGEEELNARSDFSAALGESIPVILLSARIEHELSQLDAESRPEFMADLGITQPAAHRFVRSCYEALGLISFLTVGEDEVRAWPIRAGVTAADAAGKIHTDLKRGFIRAETMAYAELQQYGDEKKLRAAGRLRSEGRDYIVHDGDIIDFRFNV